MNSFFQKNNSVRAADDYDPGIRRIDEPSETQERSPVIQSSLYVPSKPKRIGVYLKKSDSGSSLISNRSKKNLVIEDNPQELESIMTIKSEISQAESKGKMY